MAVTRKQMAGDLRKLGIRAGDILEVHSSLKAIGRVQGGAKAVIGALQDVLGKRGTLLMPSFTYCYEQRGEVFDIDESPSKVGLITEVFRQMRGVVRSCCPTHSVAAWGRLAYELTYRHALAGPLGVGSPFHLAAESGGKVVLLGCGHNSNSFIHVVEALTGHPAYTQTPPYGETALIRLPDGQVKTVHTLAQPGDSKAFGVLQPYLDRRGLIAHGLVGEAPTQVMVGQAVIDCLVPVIKRRPELPLCPPERKCRACEKRRKVIRRQGTRKMKARR